MEMKLGEAIMKAIDEMPETYIIKPSLTAHLAEVYGMLLTEYNVDDAMKLFKRDGYNEGMEKGIEKGIEKGRTESIYSLIGKGWITFEQGAESLGIPVAQLKKDMLSC